jgi:hypothetical protein
MLCKGYHSSPIYGALSFGSEIVEKMDVTPDKCFKDGAMVS